MKMYSLIAEEYDNLFPHSKAKTVFVESFLPPGPVSLLDLGCATGELLLSLAGPGRTLTGIDLDGEMIGRAEGKCPPGDGKPPLPRFIAADMAAFLSGEGEQSRDMILCFGNTLAYLDGPGALAELLDRARAVLRPGGRMFIQILNYDSISPAEEFRFPELITDRVIFGRRYTPGPRGYLLFHTELTDRETGEMTSDTHGLYPFPMEMIKGTARLSGFSAFRAYGGYDLREIQREDFSRLYILEK